MLRLCAMYVILFEPTSKSPGSTLPWVFCRVCLLYSLHSVFFLLSVCISQGR